MSGHLHLLRWAYADWAALVAAPIAWMLAGAPTISPIKPGTFVLIGGAFVAARVAAGHAARSNTSSHGASAATLTWLFYVGGLAAILPIWWLAAVVGGVINGAPWDTLLAALAALPYLVPVVLLFLIVASVIVLPACAIGTLLFNAGLFAIRRACFCRTRATRCPAWPDCGGTIPPL